MSTSESGSPNLLDEFFPTASVDATEDVEVVDEVDATGDEGVAPAPARRSLPPPPPSMRAGRRSAAPPPRTRSPSQPGGPPAPPSVRATFAGLGPELERESTPPALGDVVSSLDDSRELEVTEAPARFEPETTPGGFGADGDLDDEEPAPSPVIESPFDEPVAAATLEDHPEVAAAFSDGDMASALAESLSLRGDTASDPSTVAAEEDAPIAFHSENREKPLFELPRPRMPLEKEPTGNSSAWPSQAKIDEWDDDWAPSLAALGAKDPERSSAPKPEAEPPRSGSDPSRAPFRLSLPPPPPPPLRRSAPSATSPTTAAPVDVEEPEVDVEEESSPDATAAIAVNAADEPHRDVLQSIEVFPFEASDELSREDLTRPLPPTELARLAATEDEEALPARSEADLVRDDVTIPLPPLEERNAALLDMLPDPYTSDTDLTRPLIPVGESSDGYRGLILPPLRPPPSASAGGTDVPLIVAVPPPTVGTVEHAPSIQITPGADGSEYTPTSQLQKPWKTSTSPGMRGVLPPIPKPAPIPSDFAKRGPSASVAPVTGSVFPPAGSPARKRWAIALAAVTFTALVFGIGLRSRSGSLVVTVAGPGGEAVSGVSVRIDGTERCNTAPCIVKDLKAGMHLVSASASGLQASADRAVVLESGGQVAQHIALSAEERSTSGLSVAAIGTGLHVQVDGRDVGAPPVTLNDVTPGEHTVRIVGAERYYQPYEEVVRLERGEVRSLGPVRLRVLRGRLDLRAGAGSDGAAVAVDGKRVWRLPASVELSAEESHEVSAVKAGYPEFNQEIVFDGAAERSVNIAFGSDGAGMGASQASYQAVSSSATRSLTSSSTAKNTRSVAQSAAPAPAAPSGGTATLDLSSTPPAAVVVNGRPLGTTPIHGVHVGAGKQTVVFVHPTMGRKVASANVAPGGRAAIGVKF